MRQRIDIRAREKGQTMPIIGLLLATGVLIGFLMIAVDGGSALLQRRTMQNSAEAAVMAGIDAMGKATIVSCNTTPCHTSFLLSNNGVLSVVNSLAAANRGGTTKPATYRVSTSFHFMLGTANCPGPDGPSCYLPVPGDDQLIAPNVDGLMVTTVISNPTIFASAFFPKNGGGGQTILPVVASAAARLYPTCAPDIAPGGPTGPLVQFRPKFEWAMHALPNDPANPIPFWNYNSDIGGNTGDANWHNVVSFRYTSNFYNGPGIVHPNPSQFQLFVPDGRSSSPPPGLCDYPSHCPGPPYPRPPSTMGCGGITPCALMDGSPSTSGAFNPIDVYDWIFWRWGNAVAQSSGQIRLDTPCTSSKMNCYRATDATDYGRCNPSLPGCNIDPSARKGDWAEIQIEVPEVTATPGILGATQQAVQQWGSTSPISGGTFNGGRTLTTTLYVWGAPAATPGVNFTYSDSGKSAQYFYEDHTAALPPTPTPTPCSGPCPPTPTPQPDPVWADYPITGSCSAALGCSFADTRITGYRINRVNFTKAYTIILYENKLSTCGPNVLCGYVSSPYLTGPRPDPGPPATCATQWETGGGVYSREISPP